MRLIPNKYESKNCLKLESFKILLSSELDEYYSMCIEQCTKIPLMFGMACIHIMYKCNILPIW